MNKQFLIINEPNYKEITEVLTHRAEVYLKSKGFDTVVMTAPDISEIPTVLRYLIKSAELRVSDFRYQGYVALGCKEFGSDDTRDIMNSLNSLKMQYSLALGVGIIAPKDMKHGVEWAASEATNAAERAVQLLDVKRGLGL